MAELPQIQIHPLTHQSTIPSDRAQQASPNNIATPEKELIMCAVKLAVLEKVASGLGVLGFMVATVVVLGGLVTMLEMKDFVLVGLMLIIEGIRIIYHMHYTQQLMMPIICFITSWFQLVSAIIIGAVSAMRLASQDFGKTEEANIRNFALNIFYVVVLAEAHVLLAKKVFFEWKITVCELLKKVNDECGLGPSDMVSIERFFKDAYYKSVTQINFDAFKMDLISFAEELLISRSGEEQLMGVRILEALSTHDLLSDGALRKIGASTAVIARLIQMRTYNNIFGENIRDSSAVILRKLALKEPKVLGVAGMEEPMI